MADTTETVNGVLGRPSGRCLYCFASGRRDVTSGTRGVAWPLCVFALPFEDIVLFVQMIRY